MITHSDIRRKTYIKPSENFQYIYFQVLYPSSTKFVISVFKRGSRANQTMFLRARVMKAQRFNRTFEWSNVCGLIGVCPPIQLRPVNRKRLKVGSIELNEGHIGKVRSIMLNDCGAYRARSARGFRSRTNCQLQSHVKIS